MGTFHFKQFDVTDTHSAMKIGTDGVLLGAWATPPDGCRLIVDAGTGSGLIALMMAQRTLCPKIIGVEIESGAILDAVANALTSPWARRLTMTQDDILNWSPPEDGHPMLIVSNPPFFTETLRSPDSDRALARHGEGLDVGSLISWADSVMTHPLDRLAFIAPADRDDEIEFSLTLHRFNLLERCRLSHREGQKPIRTLWLAGREMVVPKHNSLVINSQEYRSLTSPFYLDK